jgi:hypothetical protein
MGWQASIQSLQIGVLGTERKRLANAPVQLSRFSLTLAGDERIITPLLCQRTLRLGRPADSLLRRAQFVAHRS